jgi:hypothetical protein
MSTAFSFPKGDNERIAHITGRRLYFVRQKARPSAYLQHVTPEDLPRAWRVSGLPKRAPKLNPMDTLWGQAKDAVSANKQYVSLDQQVERFLAYLWAWSNREALTAAGVYARDFWLSDVLSKSFCAPA